MPPRYRLKLQRLDFVSLVDDPAQPNAKCLLIKRRNGGAAEFEATARLVKTNDELGLAFFWAFTSTNNDGTDHFDLQGDQVVADDAMIKAAMAFMEKGGAVDEMHDSDPDGGRVVFAMPMTPEIAKAFGVTSKTNGLMIAIKPSADAMAKLKDGTYRAVSIAGLGERETVKSLAGRVIKSTLYTNEVDGHQHEVCVYDDGSLYVCYATSAGADNSHSHGIVFENGTLTILADSGHSHELAEGQPGVAVVPADALVIIQASNSSSKSQPSRGQGGGKSTPFTAIRTVKTQPEPKPMNLLKMLALFVACAPTEQAYVTKMTDEKEVEVFLGKAANDRAEIVKSARGVEVYKSDRLGRTFYATDDQTMVAMAKDADVTHLELQKAKLRAENAEIEKRAATELSHFAKGVSVAGAILRAVDGIADEAVRKDAIESLKGANAAMKELATAKGVTETGGPVALTKASAYAALNKGLVTFCAEKRIEKVWTEGLDAFGNTPEGAALIKAHDDAKRAESKPATAN